MVGVVGVVGVVVGVGGVSNLLRWLMDRYEAATLGVLLGLLLDSDRHSIALGGGLLGRCIRTVGRCGHFDFTSGRRRDRVTGRLFARCV